MRVHLIKSPNREKKWRAIFTDEDGTETHTDFGSAGMSDYTIHHDKLRRANYLSRHRTTETWNKPKTAGALSRWLLWGDSTSLQTNLASFKRRFSLA
jgi:hypothetical protein